MNFFFTDYSLDNSLRCELLEEARVLLYRNYKTTNNNILEINVASNLSSKPNLKLSSNMKYLLDNVNKDLKPVGITFVYFRPFTQILPHIDDDERRTSCLTFPLSDLTTFSPAKYFDNDKNLTEVLEYKKEAVMISTRSIHSVENNDYDRYSVQICFKQKIEDLYKIHKENFIIKKEHNE